VTQASNRNLQMTDPLITMAEEPSQASCKNFHCCALPHPTARSLKTAKGELASLSNAQIGFPDLDPASRAKLRYGFPCQVSLSLACRPTAPDRGLGP